jgi:hypothetical protein
METDVGLVRPNALSGLYGGITMRQYEQVQRLAGWKSPRRSPCSATPRQLHQLV